MCCLKQIRRHYADSNCLPKFSSLMISPWFPHLWQSHLSKMFCFRNNVLFRLYFHCDFTWSDVDWMNRWVFEQGIAQRRHSNKNRVFADHIQSAFSSIHVFFKKKQKVIISRFPTCIFWFVFNDWHHSWHNNGLRRLIGLWRKKSQRDLAEGMLGMLVQCIKALYAVLTVEPLCVLSW